MLFTASARVSSSSPVCTSMASPDSLPCSMSRIFPLMAFSGTIMRFTNLEITSAPTTKLIVVVIIITSTAMKALPRNSLASQATTAVQSVPRIGEAVTI